MTFLAITLVGLDQPGIIASVADVLAASEMNLEDSSMTLLRGQFAMTLICAGNASADAVELALAPLGDLGLEVLVKDLLDDHDQAPARASYLVSVHGADRLGIVAQLARVIADAGGNITDLTTRLSGGLYVVLAEIDLTAEVGADTLRERLAHVSAELGVDTSFRLIENDEL